jgi:hypothetical protein
MTRKDIENHLLGYFSVIKGLFLFNPLLHNPNNVFHYLFFGYSPTSFVLGASYIAIGIYLIYAMKKKYCIRSLVTPLQIAAALWFISGVIEFYLSPGLSTFIAPIFISIYCIFVASNFFVNGRGSVDVE